MIGGLCPYPEMKESGLPWLGAVPALWEVRRIKTLLKEVDNRTVSGEERLLSLRMRQGLVDHIDAGGKPIDSEALVGFKIIEPGQVVMNRMRAASGLFGVASVRGLVSPDYAVFNPRPDALTPYLLHAFRLRSLAAVFRAESKGLGTGESGFLRLYTDRFGPIPVPCPPLDEQRLIVRFLDWHGAQTAKLVRAKKKIIALLNEQKQAIIHRAVTRGLDTNVKPKPSGIPWLGDVLEHWEVKRLRNVANLRVSNIDKKSLEHELPVRLCNYVDVYKNDVIHAELPFMRATASKDEIERFRLHIGDVIITKDSEDWKDIGIPALVTTEADDLVCAYHLGLLRPIAGEVHGAFLFWQLLAPDVRYQFSVAANGVTRYGLSHGSIKELILVVPGIKEQAAIAADLDAATLNLRTAISETSREIALVQEFRARLIADVVTGKLDVRAAAVMLPETEEESEPIEPADDTQLDEAELDAEADVEEAV